MIIDYLGIIIYNISEVILRHKTVGHLKFNF